MTNRDLNPADDQRAAERCRDADWTSVPCEPVCRRCGRDLPDGSELDRLRAELAETRRVGDALAAVAEALRDGTSSNRRANLTVAQNAWRSARGDAPAPAEPPADPTRTSPASTGVGWVLTDPDVALPIHAWSPGLIRDELAAKLGIPGADITVDFVAGQLRTPTVQVTLRMAELIADGAARGGSR